MNEQIIEDKKVIPTEKIYKDKAFWVGTFLGGPLVAGYLFSKNFKVLGQPEKVTPTWTIAIISTIIIFGIVFSIPDDINIPSQLIPLAYTLFVINLFKKYQKEKTLEHINQGGLIYGWGNVIGIGIIGLLITLLPIFAIGYTVDTINEANSLTKSYGVAVKHEVSFDTSNMLEKEADKIAEGFTEAGFFDMSVEKYVYVVKNEQKYEISISVVEGLEHDPESIQFFRKLRTQMDDYLPNNKVEFKLVVDYLDNVVKELK